MSIQISTLSNGLRVITDENDRVDSVAAGIWVNVGTRHETSDLNGIAHFLEHMAFKGTKTRTAREIAEAIENVGGYVNAATSREMTSFYVRLLKQDLELGLDILADILQNSIFDESEIEREREVILQEIFQCHDTPDDIIFDHFQATAFPSQQLGRSILGPQQIVKAMTRDKLVRFYADKYVASRMVLSVAGNMQHEEVVRLAEEKFSQIKSDAQIQYEPASYKGGVFTQERDLEQLHLLLGYEGVPIDDAQYYTFAVLATLLGGGMSSRLFQEVREKRGLAYTIYAFKSCFTDSGLFGIYAGTAPNQAEDLIDVIHKETANLSNSLVDSEISRAKSQLKASWLMGLENIPTRCEQLAQHMIYFGRPISRPEIIDRIEAVEKDALVQISEQVFSGNRTFVALGNTQGLTTSKSLAS